MDITHSPNLNRDSLNTLAWHSFSENISQLQFWSYKRKENYSSFKFLFDEMSINLHMLCFIMLHRIVSNCYSRHIITIQTHTKSDSTFLIHKSLHTPSVMLLTSALALDLATTGCFLLLQVTRFPPTKVKYIER